MKRIMALLLALALCVGLADCSGQDGDTAAQTDGEVHKIGVIVYNTADEEVIGFREYLKGYIEDNFEMVDFVYSGNQLSRRSDRCLSGD